MQLCYNFMFIAHYTYNTALWSTYKTVSLQNAITTKRIITKHITSKRITTKRIITKRITTNKTYQLHNVSAENRINDKTYSLQNLLFGHFRNRLFLGAPLQLTLVCLFVCLSV